jgi:cobalt-zinc-cadmium efflux system protein
VSPEEVEAYLRELAGVRDVHDLHIWGMSTTEAALTAHLIKPDVVDEDTFLSEVCKSLHNRFGIEHATLQIERGHGPTPCGLASAEVV